MREHPLSRGDLRRLLSTIFSSDVELEAFCIDYFHSVSKNFSAGMDRQQKLNILLETVSAEELQNNIRHNFPHDYSRHLLGQTAEAHLGGRHLINKSLWLGILIGIVITILSTALTLKLSTKKYQIKEPLEDRKISISNTQTQVILTLSVADMSSID